MMIPYKFKLGPHTFRVSQPLSLPRGMLGQTWFSAPYQVQVATHSSLRLRRRTPVQRAETFWHEVTHAILHDMEHPLWKNEQFVTQFSKRLNQVVQTAKLT
jgi:hypothetical protein